ncbi:hypothetical protein V6N11_020613 [Hibiscus sabdariffa]|uniref:Uncharacterized protein n=1 Tax=Hibiscus sabdariffa TaxID=183260 RepID=A0ABR2Q9A0_9ROSI
MTQKEVVFFLLVKAFVTPYWYCGLRPLGAHAKTKRLNRVKFNWEPVALLDEELCRRDTSVVPVDRAYGKWMGISIVPADKAYAKLRGLKDYEKDHEIVWLPMVMIIYTRLDQDENEKNKDVETTTITNRVPTSTSLHPSSGAKHLRHEFKKGIHSIDLPIVSVPAVFVEALDAGESSSRK